MKILTVVVFWAVLMIPYILNGYKLAGCDFESNYKCEIIHGIGVVVPPAAWVTAWFADDRRKQMDAAYDQLTKDMSGLILDIQDIEEQ